MTARIENRQDLCIHIHKAKTGTLINQIMLHEHAKSSMQHLRFIGLFSLKKATDADENDACNGGSSKGSQTGKHSILWDDHNLG